MFQYISCCYLSTKTFGCPRGAVKFQYISCYYLSRYMKENPAVATLFQYISCCYLSRYAPVKMSSLNYFNTSHVVIYLNRIKETGWDKYKFQYISCCYLSVLWLQKKLFLYVSIHLMLLFIWECQAQVHVYYTFQYISCCYLS